MTNCTCLKARYDDFAFVSAGSPAVLNYTLCTVSTGNMKELHQHLSEKSLWDGLKESDVEVVNTLLTEPVWQIAPAEADLLTEQAILNYTEDVISLGFFRQGQYMTCGLVDCGLWTLKIWFISARRVSCVGIQ